MLECRPCFGVCVHSRFSWSKWNGIVSDSSQWKERRCKEMVQGRRVRNSAGRFKTHQSFRVLASMTRLRLNDVNSENQWYSYYQEYMTWIMMWHMTLRNVWYSCKNKEHMMWIMIYPKNIRLKIQCGLAWLKNWAQ